jgi:outer membrane immunogenic protein
VSDNAPITTTAGVIVAGSNQFTTRDLSWLSTVRGRIGYAWDRVLLYVTGGAAWSKATYSANYATAVVSYPIAPFSQTKTGYVLGGGLEYAVTSNLTIRGEYLYYRFDGADATCLCNPPFFVAYHWDNTTLNVVRLGINYKLDWAGPVVARY